jgi:hypothetical protein
MQLDPMRHLNREDYVNLEGGFTIIRTHAHGTDKEDLVFQDVPGAYVSNN